MNTEVDGVNTRRLRLSAVVDRAAKLSKTSRRRRKMINARARKMLGMNKPTQKQ